MFYYQLHETNDQVMVQLNGDLDIEGTEVVNDELSSVLTSYTKVELNFTDVRFVDSTGIGLLIQLVQLLQEKKIETTITNLNSDIYEVFSLLQIPEILGEDIFI